MPDRAAAGYFTPTPAPAAPDRVGSVKPCGPVDDWRLTDEGGLVPFDPEAGGGAGPSGRLGNWLTVNGSPLPLRVEVPTGGRVRLRLANACNARIMRLRDQRVTRE